MHRTVLLGMSICGLAAQEAPWPRVKPVLVARGFEYPVDIQSARDGSGRLFVVEQAGRIRIWQGGQVLAAPFLDIRSKVRSGGERGLLGLVFSPRFMENKTFYVNYTEGQGAPDLRTVVARYRVSAADPNVADSASEERLLVVDQPFDNHNAGQLAFSPRDGQLYVGMGDGGSGGDPQGNGQNPSRLLGKMLRLDVERAAKPVPELWALGLRNPWRFAFDRETGDLWIADVGQNRLEEVNFQAAEAGPGLNYGWNEMEASECYRPNCRTAGMVLPVFEYGRSLGASVTGGYVYRGSVYPERRGTYLLADYVSERIWGVRREGSKWAARELARYSGWSISTFGEGEDGELYFATHAARDGALYRLADQTPVTRTDLVVNAATGQEGAVAGARINIYGWGIVGEGGQTRVFFDDVEAQVVAADNLGGQELIVAVVPAEMEGREKSGVVVAVGIERSAVVEVTIPRVQPGILDLGYVVEGSGHLDLEVTGLGSCARQLSAAFGEIPAAVAGCRASEWFAGVQQLTVQVPQGISGEARVRVAAEGVESPEVRVVVQ